jgi:hypothetical protein
MRATHVISRIGFVLMGAGLLVTLVLSVGLRCIEPHVEKMPNPVGLEVMTLDYRPLGISLSALGTIIVVVAIAITDDNDE